MKKTFKQVILLTTLLTLTIGCSKNEQEKIIEKDFSCKFDIASIKPLDGDLNIYKDRSTSLLKSQSYSDGTFIQFDVQQSDGLVINVLTIKGWGSRWVGGVDWAIGRMSGVDVLACMAVGKWCAGGIAALCAVAATENMHF